MILERAPNSAPFLLPVTRFFHINLPEKAALRQNARATILHIPLFLRNRIT
jgi:hypothetical protein